MSAPVIHEGPAVYAISRPSIDLEEVARFLGDRGLGWARSAEAGPGEELVEVCGRLCYLSFTEDTSRIRHPNARYIRHLIDSGHDSVLEHANWTLILDRVSRAFTHQLVRHRAGFAYSQLSQQYRDHAALELVIPAEIAADPATAAAWRASAEHLGAAYGRIVEGLGGVPAGTEARERRRQVRSAARSLLPNATSTAIAVTANARALRHFLSVRGAIEGDVEMRRVAAEILRLVAPDAPTLFEDFEIATLDDGWPIVRHHRPAPD